MIQLLWEPEQLAVVGFNFYANDKYDLGEMKRYIFRSI